MIETELNRLLENAKRDPALKEALLKTRETDDPVEDFCALAQSVNAVAGWDDAYEQFFTALIWTS